ncbi:MAG TPA: glycine dehydrogenase (aminomethyl-transferring), partial [Acidobacteriota bacterium]|nr:glycine dehydrogenase (aminomethyl-transferring) [Acidobacteriota bacterium]
MLQTLGYATLDHLIDETVPRSIRLERPLDIGEARSEDEVLEMVRKLASQNQVFRSFIGMGYYDTLTPAVIQRNILENPGWYTQYTPYQAEISQGRLEALLNFQTVVSDLTGLAISNASLLDEGTAAAEAMGLCFSASRSADGKFFFVSDTCHPQTIDVVTTRAESLGIEIVLGHYCSAAWSEQFFGALVQYPDTNGEIHDYSEFANQVHSTGALIVCAADLLSLTLLRPPGEWGADVAVGSAQRFGVPLGFGGPHAGFLAVREEFRRLIPGRVVGVSKDVSGQPALRLALQTREQHIRRDKATSNICTAQVLLAIMASMYAVYHGADGLKQIGSGIRGRTALLAAGLNQLGIKIRTKQFFDTLQIEVADPEKIRSRSLQQRINLRHYPDASVGVSIDEATRDSDIEAILKIVSDKDTLPFELAELDAGKYHLETAVKRETDYLTHPVFSRYHSETELLRYIHRLQRGDLSLTTSMIPLGSCTMKLNAAAEMLPITWPEW